MIVVSTNDVSKIEQMMTTLVEWSGISDDTPDDTEILEYNGMAITVGDVRDAVVTLQKCKHLTKAT
jgi:hypothetical protein